MGKSVEHSKESKCNTDKGDTQPRRRKNQLKEKNTEKGILQRKTRNFCDKKQRLVRNTRSKSEIKTSTLSVMMQNENAKDHCTGSEATQNIKSNQEEKETKDVDIKNVFNVEIVKQTNNSITLEWNLISETDMYAIELHHKVKGWQMVEWTTACYASVNKLEENFGYQFRVKALKLYSLAGQYTTLYTSPAVVGITLPPEPTTICLFRAIKNDQQFLVKRILRRRPSLIEYPGPNGYLPLANAIAFSQMCIVDFILSSGANVNVGNPNNNRTPLHEAFYYGRLPVARMLLNKKANLEAKDICGLTASHMAVDANQGEILKFALENGANVEARDACGWTLLMHAVFMNSDLSILKLLINFGANIESKDLHDLNCQDLARLYKYQEAQDYFNKIIKLKREKEENGQR